MAVNSTAIWRVRPSGSNTNGGGYDPGISGAATDYSQQNSAQATGTVGTSTASTTFTDAGGAFTAAMVGNALWIASGAGFTTGAYFITAFTNSTTITLDRASGTGTAAHWAVGGGWADFWTNTTSSGPLVAGNTVYILGSGTPNPASYTYDYTFSTTLTPTVGTSSKYVTFANDPSTPGYLAPPNTSGGMPCIRLNDGGTVSVISGAFNAFNGLWFVSNGLGAGSNIVNGFTNPILVFGCVFDQYNADVQCAIDGVYIVGCEMFSSVAPSAGTNYAITESSVSGSSDFVIGCNIHDCVGGGIQVTVGGSIYIQGCIIAKCQINGISLISSTGAAVCCTNNTIDGNLGSGLICTSGKVLIVINNIFSNHTQAGKFGLSSSGAITFADYNTYYNNTSNYSGVTAGSHDTALGVTPYVGSATENYSLV